MNTTPILMFFILEVEQLKKADESHKLIKI